MINHQEKKLLLLLSLDANAEAHPNVGMQHSMRLFRAQRNFYITGFSIFLILVIRRLVMLISTQATLLAQSEASMRQVDITKQFRSAIISYQYLFRRLKVHQLPLELYSINKKKPKMKKVMTQLKHKNW